MLFIVFVAKLPAWHWFITVSTRCVSRCQPNVFIYRPHPRSCRV